MTGSKAPSAKTQHVLTIEARPDRQVAGGDQGLLRTPPLKAAFDKAAALFLLVGLAPLFALIALAIKINGWLHPEDRGSILYKEARVSQDRVFPLYKFRVVKIAAMEASRARKGYDHVKPLERSGNSKTRVGRWLQRWYLDELPQLLNVLMGDLSLVGPRPWPVHMYAAELDQGVFRKRLLRPGLTGLVQVHKGELEDLGGSRALDEAYIEACRTLSPVRLLLFDLRVIADTLGVLAKGQGL